MATEKMVTLQSLHDDLNRIKDALSISKNVLTLDEVSIYTLAQKETSFSGLAIIYGRGSELCCSKAIKNRAKKKVISQRLALSLKEVCSSKGHDYRLKSFWNTFHCQNHVTICDGKLHGSYCKNRFCTLCNSIRKAVLINKYLPVLRDWKGAYFVTLTVRSIRIGRLKELIDGVLRAFDLIRNKYIKRYQRGSGIKLVGIKSLECNFNAGKRTYNPHLHLIVPDKETADILIKEWLNLWTSKWTSSKAQNARPVEKMESDMIEIIKYGSKIFTEPDIEKKKRRIQQDRMIYARALYNILDAMHGRRVFDRFGFNLPKTEKAVPIGGRIVPNSSEWIFSARHHDWLHAQNELVLLAFEPEISLVELLENRIDTETE